MTRPSIQIVTFLILLNLTAGVITASGVGAALNINPEIGGDERVEATNESASSVEPSQGLRDTLFSMYTSTAGTLKDIVKLVFYGPAMLQNLGVPKFLTTFLFGGASVIVAVDVIHYLTGRG